MFENWSDSQVKIFVGSIALIGIILGWFGRSIGFMLSRLITGAQKQEAATYFNSLADLATKLKAGGMSVSDVKKLEDDLRSRPLSDSSEVANLITEADTDEIESFTSTYAMRMRTNARYDVSDANLNKTFLDLCLVLDESEEAAYEDMQDKWKEYRLALMEAAGAQYGSGTLGPIVGALSGLAETERRTAELQEIINQRVKRLRYEQQLLREARTQNLEDDQSK